MQRDHEFYWRSQRILSLNREPDRVSFIPQSDADLPRQDMAHQGLAHRTSERVILLNGTWQFAWYPSPLEVPDEYLSGGAAPEGTIEVPLNWQFGGFGKIHYTDEAYPFPINPPSIPLQNETGVYTRDVVLTAKELSGGKRIFLNFEGVESAFTVWVNGRKVGFNQGSRMHSEFEVTSYLQDGRNRITVQVMQYSSATYLEDQDQWWLGGIIRDVYLLVRPAQYIQNFRVDTDWIDGTGTLQLRVDMTEGEAHLKVELFADQDSAEPIVTKNCLQNILNLTVPNAEAWTAETPRLYRLVLTLVAGDGQILEVVSQLIGFRHLEIRDGVLLWNGRKIFLKGVNRHEFNSNKGRVSDYEQTLQELTYIKTAGFNAVRTSHYPNHPHFYDICDRLGLYVIDEADLETHGFEIEGKPTQIADDPEWQEAYVERVSRMVERDRNHVSIVLWSLGNESSYGPNFAAMYDWCKANEPTRPVHYEGDSHNQTVDVSSTMYSSIGNLMERDLYKEPVRPHILCEFGHAMGNGAGSLSDYYDALAKADRIQGAFIWEFKDHGIRRCVRDHDVDCEADQFLYGGDFGELYHNKNFCLDGIIDSRTQAKPPFLELRKVIESLRVTSFDESRAEFDLLNRFDFLDTDHMCVVVHLYSADHLILAETLDLPLIAAGESAIVRLSDSVKSRMGEAEFIFMDFCLRKDAESISRNLRSQESNTDLDQLLPIVGSFGQRLHAHEISASKETETVTSELPTIEETKANYLVKTRSLAFRVSKTDGLIYELQTETTPLMPKGPGLNLYRAGTDNDVKMQPSWDYFNLHSMVMDVAEISQRMEGTHLIIAVAGRYGAEAKFFGMPVTWTYEISYEDRIELKLHGHFEGKGPEHLPKIGLTSMVEPFFSEAIYDGLGPHENYCDRKASVRPGVWTLPTDDREVYDFPQEYGNRHDVRYVRLTGDKGTLTVRSVNTAKGFDLALRPYSDLELREKQHRFELEKDGFWYLHTDYFNSGLGSASCGPERLVPYRVYPLPFNFAIELSYQP